MKKVLYISVTAIILSGFIIAVMQVQELFANEKTIQIAMKKSIEEKNKALPIQNINTLKKNIKSKEALLINLNTNQVLYAKEAEKRAYPASLTKLMTVIVALENIPNLQNQVTVPDSIFNYIQQANASIAGFKPNEKVTVEDILYGVMLPSGADASLAIAKYVAGDEKNFVHLMNEKAKELDMDQTHFENVEGLHHDNHYSTAHDLMKLLQYGMKNITFKEIFSAKQYGVQKTNLRPQGFSFSSTLFNKINPNKKRSFTFVGGKTGYTLESGLSLASVANKKGKTYALITLNAKGAASGEPMHIVDAITLYSAIK